MRGGPPWGPTALGGPPGLGILCPLPPTLAAKPIFCSNPIFRIGRFGAGLVGVPGFLLKSIGPGGLGPGGLGSSAAGRELCGDCFVAVLVLFWGCSGFFGGAAIFLLLFSLVSVDDVRLLVTELSTTVLVAYKKIIVL